MPEFDLFGTDFTARCKILDQQVAELRRLWGNECDNGLNPITPAPAQDTLPIWLGYQGPKGARRAGLMGEGLLTAAKTSWPHYRDGLAGGGHDPAAARMAGGIQAYVTDDPARPRRSPRRSASTPGTPRCIRCGSGRRWRAWPGTCAPHDWDAIIGVHLKGTFAVLHHAAAFWRQRAKEGHVNDARVINTASPSGLFGNPGQANYGAAKAGIASLTVIAARLRRLGRAAS